jgi:hypothetical protein
VLLVIGDPSPGRTGTPSSSSVAIPRHRWLLFFGEGIPDNIVCTVSKHSIEVPPMTPEDLIDELRHKVVLAPDEFELEAALGELQSALQEHCNYLESVSADYLLSLPLAIRKRLSKLHETTAA